MTLTRTWVVVVYGWLAKHFSAPCVVGLRERNFTLVLLCFAAVYLPRLAWWLVVALLDAPSARRKAAGVGFFRFPKENTRRKAWVQAVRREKWQPSDSSRICGLHFITGK